MLTLETLFMQTLQLAAPWIITDIKFSETEKLLEIWISFNSTMSSSKEKSMN